jgi:transcriptional regulator with XRE-family HTH domain
MTIYGEVGRRIRQLREKSGFSQKALAKKMGISRPAVSMIESGERKIAADELLKLSRIFHITLEDILTPRKQPEVILHAGKPKKPSKQRMRINVPQKNLRKFKEVLLYILNKIGSKPNIGETVIYKLLYFIDFDFYERYEEQLVGATYIKNRYGPTPVEFVKIVDQMIEDEKLEKVKSEYYSYPQTKYLPLKKPDLKILKAHEIETIDEVLNRLSDMNASQLSDYSHADIPWVTTAEGEAIEYESVFYRTPLYSVRGYEDD